jgi:cell division protein FtsW
MSSALIVVGIAFIMLFVASPKYSHYIILAVAGVSAIGIYLINGSGFRNERFDAWLEPEKYASSTAYQTIQSLYAIGSGGLTGKGLGQSVQKLGYVPEAQNDMVFSIICEELGLFGGIAVILLFLLMIWRFLVIANNAEDLYGSLLAIGVMAHISIQVILNIAVVTNVIPNTGITLPFISYGGTSVVFLLMEMGLVLSVSRQIKLE